MRARKVVGVLNVESPRLEAFTERDRILLEILSMHVASAIAKIERESVLEGLVDEKTGDLLAAEQMVTAGKVAAMVAHDLKTPLQTINNALFLLQERPERAKEMIQIIKDSVKRADELIESFRYQMRDIPPQMAPVDLAGLIKRSVEETVIQQNVDVSLDLGEGMGEVMIDGRRMRRVMDNLIRNALEAMPLGGEMRISAEADGDSLKISVSDTGMGIPEDQISNIYKPFHSTKKSGLGLGLAYCKMTVEAHGGKIMVDSVVGKGTTFTILMNENYTSEHVQIPAKHEWSVSEHSNS